MKNIFITVALLAGLTFGSASAQTDENNSETFQTIYDDVGSYDVASGTEIPVENDGYALNVPTTSDNTSVDVEEWIKDVEDGAPPVEVNVDDIDSVPTDSEVEWNNLDDLDLSATDDSGELDLSGADDFETAVEPEPGDEDINYENITKDGQVDTTGSSKDNSGVQTSCVNGTCTVYVDGMLRGEYAGKSISVSTSNINGVKTTYIYVDGQLRDKF
jgi:hypothetical protein